MKMINRSNRGLTLIEILIAIIVLMVGLVGILALFPVGIHSTKETEEDSNAAIVADSVGQALQAGMRMPTIIKSGSNDIMQVRISHDGLPVYQSAGYGTQECAYTFNLPIFQDPPPAKPRLYSHPFDKDITSNNPPPLKDWTELNLTQPKYAFRLGNNPNNYIGKTYADIIKGPDSTDPYTQYAFAFTVMRVDDLDIVPNPPTSRRARPLYEFKIYVYRLPPRDTKYASTGTGAEDVKDRKPNQVFTVQISGL